jgi:hypothetical protein
MPSLTIPLPEQPNTAETFAPPKPPPIVPPGSFKSSAYSDQRPPSPVAPEFSPITPPTRPALPATYPPPELPGREALAGANSNGQTPASVIPPAEFIPQPPPQPFSSEDATDAIALRAAISSLQFQKKKAQDDIRELERIRKKALDQPALFKTELVAGRLKETTPQVGNLQAILDEADGSDDEDEVVVGASRDEDMEQNGSRNEAPQQSSESPTTDLKSSPAKTNSPDFGRIPGPQNIVRMPYVNWDKYHISGEGLDQLHEQQRKWPGSFGYGPKGREYTVAAPYSPWQDPLDTQQGPWDGDRRNDSVATPVTAVTPGSVSEHPMETRRKQTFH